MIETLGFAIVAVIAIYVAWPLFSVRRPLSVGSESEALTGLLSRRDTLYREIADLDFDHRVGKVDDEDFQVQREDYLEEAAAILQAIDWTGPAEPAHGAAKPLSPLEHEIEEEIRRLRLQGHLR